MKRRRKVPTAKCEVIDIPRRWWQSKRVRLRCSCGWESPETWPARPMIEIVYTMRFTMRAIAEVHWGSKDHSNGSE